MADAIKKFLAKISSAERTVLVDMINRILKRDIAGLNSKKLVGSKDIFRVRKGKFRIVYRQAEKDCTIISIDRRSEKTYRDF